MNWKEYRRIGRGLYYSSIFLERLRKSMINFEQDNCSPDKNLNPAHPKHEAGVLTT
jgi:hypothetical protein